MTHKGTGAARSICCDGGNWNQAKGRHQESGRSISSPVFAALLLRVRGDVKVPEPGGVSQQVVDHPLLPLGDELGEVLLHRPVQAHSTVLDVAHHRRRREQLGDRGQGKDRVAGERRRGGIGRETAEGLVQDDPAAAGDEDDQPGGVALVDEALGQPCRLPEPFSRHHHFFRFGVAELVRHCSPSRRLTASRNIPPYVQSLAWHIRSDVSGSTPIC
jgi:hypothetical protein